MDIMSWTYEKMKKAFPLGSIVYVDNNESPEGERYVVGYSLKSALFSNGIAWVYKNNNNGNHEIYDHFSGFNIKDLKKGMSKHDIPLNRHCGIQFNINKVKLIRPPYKWIKMEMEK